MTSKKLPKDVKNHFEKYWKLCIKFFEDSEYQLASFFAITLIEEIGKLSIIRNKSLGGSFDDKGFYNHHKKYIYAAFDNLSNNYRVTRIYSKKESKFAELVLKKKLFDMRNNSLYLEEDMVTPEKVISRDDAFLLVCFAGEIYAEIQGESIGPSPDEWLKILEEVNQFREHNK
ncbi:hypothetical protein Metbo_1540 [Methanobacterium lacus]|uniref:Uncharacterized protein n=1 Tax=Methanobacterium lacus (strain AL-21) TaxID=877455 RepID=F0T8U2_METLA|nr:AbiV family abortive infection protein [Methanobacterium lacus]ADZ09770.1 hypothetical protein Metbo_1540 [Methanobacterium lacus]